MVILKSCLIAGGAGFIGSNLAERLINNGDHVTIIDDLSTGTLNNLRKIRSNIEFIEKDICDTCDLNGFDAIYHLACIANPSDYTHKPLETLSSGSFGTDNLLKIAKRSGAKFYYFSSSEIYGHHEPKDGSISESSASKIKILHSRSPYYICKMFSEEYVKAYSEKNDIEYLIIRPFNIYGNNMDSKSQYGRVITNFIKWSVNDEPVCINGNGNQIRSFCHVNDLIDALITLDKLPQFKNNVINIGNPQPIKIIDLAKLILHITNSSSKIVFKDEIEYEPAFRNPDISLIKEWIGWNPQIMLNAGLEDLINQNKNGY